MKSSFITGKFKLSNMVIKFSLPNIKKENLKNIAPKKLVVNIFKYELSSPKDNI